MCGVVGFSCQDPKKYHLDLLHKIIIQSKIRGLHSFGYTYNAKKLVTVKHHDLTKLELPLTNKIIYHNRYSTSGDYKDHNNNQPITNKNISLVFNGVLDMRTKQEIEKHYNIKMQTDNDGEIILHKYEENLEKYIKETTGSFAGLILTNCNKLLAIRNTNRPLWKVNVNEAVYFASTKDIFIRADKTLEPVELKPYVLYEY